MVHQDFEPCCHLGKVGRVHGPEQRCAWHRERAVLGGIPHCPGCGPTEASIRLFPSLTEVEETPRVACLIGPGLGIRLPCAGEGVGGNERHCNTGGFVSSVLNSCRGFTPCKWIIQRLS